MRFAWLASFSFHFVIFVLTINETYKMVVIRAGLRMSSSIAMLLMRDGENSLFYSRLLWILISYSYALSNIGSIYFL